MTTPTDSPFRLTGRQYIDLYLDPILVAESIQRTHLDVEYYPADSRIVLKAREFATTGEPSTLINDKSLTYVRQNLNTLHPAPLLYRGEWPVKYRAVVKYLLDTYGIVLEDGEFTLTSGGNVITPGMDSENLPQPPLYDGCILFTATSKSLRFQTGSSFRLLVHNTAGRIRLPAIYDVPVVGDMSLLLTDSDEGSTSNTLFLSTGHECVRDLFRRLYGYVPEDTQVEFTYTDSGSSMRVDMVARAQDRETQAVGKYEGTRHMDYVRADLNQLVSMPLNIDGTSPLPYDLFVRFMLNSYGLLIEDGEFYLQSDPTMKPLRPGSMVSMVPNSTEQDRLVAHANSRRFKPGSSITFKLIFPSTIVVLGKVPAIKEGETLAYRYQLRGGFVPYTLLDTSGLPPGVTLTVDGWLRGTAPAGNYPFSARWRDNAGAIAYLQDEILVTKAVEAASNLRGARSDYGDMYLNWDGPSGARYRVDIYPDDAATTPHSEVVTTRSLTMPAEVMSATFGRNIDYLRYEVSVIDQDGAVIAEPEATYAAMPAVDNTRVKKVVGIGINSLGGGYFNDLSDRLNPGGSGIPGRRDQVAASTFRKRMALELGIEYWEVLPVMMVVGSSPINPMPYQSGFPLNNFWWDADRNAPGPNLQAADAIQKRIGRAIDYFMESGPGETTGIWFAPVEQRDSILAAWRSSNIAMLTWMRANWGNPQLEIWFQGASTSWWGFDNPPDEINWIGAHLLRGMQTKMAVEDAGFKVASYVPEGHKYTTYLNEMASGMGWVHYTVEGYHAAAAEVAEAMARNINRALSPPTWTQMLPPTNLSAVPLLNRSVRFDWTSPGTSFRLRVFHPQTRALVMEVPVTGKTYEFTEALQMEKIGFPISFCDYSVAEYTDADGYGPFEFYKDTASDPALKTPTGVRGVKQSNGDIVFTWDERPGVQHYYRNYKVGGNGAILSQGVLTEERFIFTMAQQNAAYGGGVTYVTLDLMEYNPATGTVSQPFQWNGDVENTPVTVQTPTNGKCTLDDSWNATYSWDALDGESWRVQNFNVMAGTVLKEVVVTEPRFVFTAAEQVAAYDSTAGFFQWQVTALRPSLGLESFAALFSHSTS